MLGPMTMARALTDISAPMVLPSLSGGAALLIAASAAGMMMPPPMA